MKLDKICRTCLLEKPNLKPLFEACVPTMLMSCASVQVIQGDGLPSQICTQCLQMVNRSFSFKQQCEKSDSTLRDFVAASLQHHIQQTVVSLQQQTASTSGNLIVGLSDVGKTAPAATDHRHQLFTTSSAEVLQHESAASMIFQEIFSDATSQSLIADNFASQNANTVVSDLAETMQSLQTIAEQCLPETWETDTTAHQIVSSTTCHSSSQETNNNCNNAFGLSLYRCQFCGDIFEAEWTLGEHIKIHTGQNNKNFCSILDQPIPTADNVVTQHHSNAQQQQQQQQEKKILDPSLTCQLCDTIFSTEKCLKKHLKDAHYSNLSDFGDEEEIQDPPKHVCSICDKKYKTPKLLLAHMKCHSGKKNLSCETCGKTFTLASSFYKHRYNHFSEKKFTCTVCGKKFNQTSNFNAHLRTHTGEKPYLCNICGKGFKLKAHKLVHLRTHTGEKPFKCTTCDSAFSTSTQLKKHTTKHTGERPYECWICAKTFRQKDTRDTHVRYHTGERPYACSLCPKKYIAANHLRTHMKNHRGDKEFQCNVCLKRFVESGLLRAHSVVHTAEKPYTCRICGKSFSQSTTLNGHLKNHHQHQKNNSDAGASGAEQLGNSTSVNNLDLLL